MVQQHGLGRGLSSLIPPKKEDREASFKDMTIKTMEAQGVDLSTTHVPNDRERIATSDPEPAASSVGAPGVTEVLISEIVPNPHQPRLHFDEDRLRELAESIREHGVVQSLVVSPRQDGTYELIAGERRLKASKLAGLMKVPVVIRDADEREKLELAIIENVQRHDLNPIEEARAYARLIDEFGLIQEDVAKKMGKSRSAVANAVRLLVLPIEIQRAVAEGKISEGHAKVLLSVENPEKQRAVFELIMKTGLTVRGTEAKVRESVVHTHTRRVSPVAPGLVEKADRISAALGTKVEVKPAGKGGRIVVEYYSDEELEQIVSRILP
ncbi:MAG: ParB/RepB/Spo0J family partition protein [Candidatus Moraniibacteriota bacterium]